VFENFQVKDAKAQLKTRGENVDKKTAESYDPTPSTLGVVVLTKGGRFAVTSQGWNMLIHTIKLFFVDASNAHILIVLGKPLACKRIIKGIELQPWSSS